MTPSMALLVRLIHAAPETGYEGPASTKSLASLESRGFIERSGLHGRYRATQKGVELVRAVDAQVAEADARGGAWLAKANELAEAGKHERAQLCYDKCQYWLDRSNRLRGHI